MLLPFVKMNGTGNDFVVVDARQTPVSLNYEQVRALASRSNPVTQGCDQLIILEPSEKADVFMRIYNSDGGEVDACGNATRCVGWKITQERNDSRYEAAIETNAGVLACRVNEDVSNYYRGQQAVMEANMGRPHFAPVDIPVSGVYDSDMLTDIAEELGIGAVVDATCVGMGNPHVVFFVSVLPTLAMLEAAGEKIPSIPLFSPHGANLTIAEIGEKAIFAFVYERGAGVTKSCGTAACATAVAAIRLGYRKKDVDIQVQQLQRQAEDLFVRWEENTDHVFLIGPVQKEFERSADV